MPQAKIGVIGGMGPCINGGKDAGIKQEASANSRGLLPPTG